MNRAIIYKIGKEVLKKHPEIAASIVSQLPQPKGGNIEQIPDLFELYCNFCVLDKNKIASPDYNQTNTELKRVFISAMACIYNGRRRFNKVVSATLNQKPSVTTRMIEESLFRYKKDDDFKLKVDTFLNKIENDNRAA